MARKSSKFLTPHAGAAALAVLSCALALLTAQPAEARVWHDSGAVTVQPAEPRSATAIAPVLTNLPTAPSLHRRKMHTARVAVRPVVTARHQSLVYAAVEQLSRLVARELTPVIHTELTSGPSVPILATADVRHIQNTQDFLPCAHEQAWAMARLLLAPPQI